MKNIVVEYLTEEDKQKPAYKSVINKLGDMITYRPKDNKGFLETIETLNTDYEALVVTILTHGGKDGISFSSDNPVIFWKDLLYYANSIRTKNALVLNLTAICKSCYISKCNIDFEVSIDNIWVSTNSVNSIMKGLLAAQNKSFNDFLYALDDQEQTNYMDIKNMYWH